MIIRKPRLSTLLYFNYAKHDSHSVKCYIAHFKYLQIHNSSKTVAMDALDYTRHISATIGSNDMIRKPRLITLLDPTYTKHHSHSIKHYFATTPKLPNIAMVFEPTVYHFDTHVEQGPFQYVSMDLITDLPRSNSYDAILTIVDQGCSKATKFLPCNKTIDGQGIAQLYFRHLFPWFGILKHIISDCDPRFTSHFAKAVCKATGIQQNISTTFHPRTNGQTEWMNQWIEVYLHQFVIGR